MSKMHKSRYFFGSVKVGERGQIVIPSKARKIYKINPGDQILVFGHANKGLGLMKATRLRNLAANFFKTFDIEENDNENQFGDEESDE